MKFEAVWELAGELSDVLPLATLTEEERREIVTHMRVREFAAGEVLFHQDDPAGDAFVVHRGVVKVMLHDDEGRDLLIGLYGRGEFVGMLSLFEQTARESTAVAATATTALQVRRADALRVLEQNPRAMYFLCERLADKIQELTAMLGGLAFLDIPGRLARYLLELARRDGVELTQSEIAAAIGASRERVNRALADFERRGLVAVERRGVRILDESALRRQVGN